LTSNRPRHIEVPSVRTPISITRDGKIFTGHYTIAGEMITVTYGEESRTTQLGVSPPDSLARVMLAEMIP
jgi:hypothetical protein